MSSQKDHDREQARITRAWERNNRASKGALAKLEKELGWYQLHTGHLKSQIEQMKTDYATVIDQRDQLKEQLGALKVQKDPVDLQQAVQSQAVRIRDLISEKFKLERELDALKAKPAYPSGYVFRVLVHVERINESTSEFEVVHEDMAIPLDFRSQKEAVTWAETLVESWRNRR